MEAENADDRETPLNALQHVTSVLSLAFPQESLATLKVYDPYYCKGSIALLLEQCGFTKDNVYNENVDCYSMQSKGLVPEHDLIITNPPYSGDHIHRAMQYAVKSGRFWAMLLPSYIFLRPWYNDLMSDESLLYLCPHERYAFNVEDGANTGRHIPFVTMWFIGGLGCDQKKRIISQWTSLDSTYEGAEWRKNVTLAPSVEGLPRRVRKLLPYTENKALQKKRDKTKNHCNTNRKNCPTRSYSSMSTSKKRKRV